MPQIYEMLHKDHDMVRGLLDRIIDTTDGAAKTREDLLSKVRQELEVHTKFEEDVFYPTFRKDKNDDEAREEVKDALDEHEEAKSMLDRLDKMDKTSEEFIATVRKLKSALEHHIKDEEDKIFPQARETVSSDEAEEMAIQYDDRKKSVH